MAKQALIIFVRNTIAGKAKTRLAETIGNEAALKIYRQLLQHTLEVTGSTHCDKIVYYSDTVAEKDIWDARYKKKVQQGKDLGERMYNAFRTAFADGYEKVVIIGSDIYDLKTIHITEAFKLLTINNIVIGPAVDGGYYLLGMKTLHPAIFKEKTWGTATVLQETLETIKEKKIHMLETLNDIDIYEDIVHIEAFKPFLKPGL